jgi:predicted ATPase
VGCAEEHGFPVHRAEGLVFTGWALAERGHAEQGVELMRQGLETLAAVGTHEDFPVLFEMLAEVHAAAGRSQQALEILDRALAETQDNGLAYWTAELHRRRGEILAAISADRDDEARTCFWRAIEVAQVQRARSLELRALMSLARLQKRRGDPRAAHERLRSVFATFSEGLDSRDLQEARAALDESGRGAEDRPAESAAPPAAS